jgi:pentose-5-phosphate-3-epimerase
MRRAPPIIAPSILSADFGRLAEEVRAVDAAGADHLLVQSDPSATRHLHRVLSQLRDLGKKAGVVLEVDGGQNCENVGLAVEAGATAIVAGSAIFGSDDYRAAIARIRTSASGGRS